MVWAEILGLDAGQVNEIDARLLMNSREPSIAMRCGCRRQSAAGTI